MKTIRALHLALLAPLLLSGCMSLPYKVSGDRFPNSEPLPKEQQISRGEPYWFPDYAGRYFFSLPEKLVLWNWKMGSHDISEETENELKRYLAFNGLNDVRIRLNEYDPFDDFDRLSDNDSVGAGWRYTVGVLTVLLETIIPGRVFGGDHFNPYTNTIHLYSDLPVVALHEAGHAKDFAETKWKGTRAITRLLPLVALRDEYLASSDALSYTGSMICDEKLHESGYKLLYPAYGTYIGGQLSLFIPGASYLSYAMAIPGHIVGRIRAGDADEEVCAAPLEQNAEGEQPRS